MGKSGKCKLRRLCTWPDVIKIRSKQVKMIANSFHIGKNVGSGCGVRFILGSPCGYCYDKNYWSSSAPTDFLVISRRECTCNDLAATDALQRLTKIGLTPYNAFSDFFFFFATNQSVVINQYVYILRNILKG